jgi:16S rRNA (cytosine967-C5)-methyltransferase
LSRQPAISAARQAASRVLLAVERGQSHSDELLRAPAINALSPPDRHLATALVLGVLRWQIQLDHQVRVLLKKPNAKLDPEILIALRLGAFQLLHLDRIPARAAIDESVELAKQAGHKFASGMVNAVLRKLAAAPYFDFAQDTAANLAMAQAHPAWLVERWAAHYGLAAARAICCHGQAQPALTVRLASAAGEEELAAEGVTLASGSLLTATRVVTAGDATATAAYRAGRVRIQDEGSQLVAEIAGTAGSILDCCAAPGGKTLILAERNPHAKIVACEANAERLNALRTRLAACAGQVECRLADATKPSEEAAFELVLADVPCSGTGTLGRNPEIRHRLKAEDFARQAERQKEILRAAVQAVRPGGRVVYSTCSLEPEENEQVIAAVLAENPSMRVVPVQERIAAMDAAGLLAPGAAKELCGAVTPEGALRLLPGAFATDGFFIALMQRMV